MIPPNNEIKWLEKDTIGALPVLHSDRLLSRSQLMVDLSFYVTLPIALPNRVAKQLLLLLKPFLALRPNVEKHKIAVDLTFVFHLQ